MEAKRIVRKVDHFFVPLTDPIRGWVFLTDILGLPFVGYDGSPVDPRTEAGRTMIETQKDSRWFGGLVGLGNANFEPFPAKVTGFPTGPVGRISGIAFEPDTINAVLLEEIDRRGISHSPPSTFTGADSEKATWSWTTVWLSGLVKEPDRVFLCEYHSPLQVVDHDARRKSLSASGGGVLGVLEASEIVIGTNEWGELVKRWQNFLDPVLPRTPGHWRVGSGPSIRIVEANDDAVLRLVLRVRSLDAAEEAARRLGFAIERREAEVRLQPEALDGLAIALRPSEALLTR